MCAVGYILLNLILVIVLANILPFYVFVAVSIATSLWTLGKIRQCD